ncbi:MAG: sigma 54-interacting transcriptional regulator, partial [Nannocystaceae bacterium]
MLFITSARATKSRSDGGKWDTLAGPGRFMSAPMLIRVLLGISEPKLRARLRRHLQQAHLLVTPLDGKNVLRQLTSESYDLALLNRLPDGVESLAALIERVNHLPDRPDIVVVGARDDVERRAELLAAGTVAVLERTLTDDALETALSTLIERRRKLRLERLAAAGPRRYEDPKQLIATSPGMRRVVTTAERVAMTSSPVLLLGETGVGKERVAQLIHNCGPWARGPFVAVNCAAIPSELFESELFGHERGAFTGAIRGRRGRFELADQGTLFLDEVGEVPLHLQAKLLRVLQQRTIEPLGSERSVAI